MEIFTMGTNEAGRHGRGAALYARQHYGAIYGQGEGIQGQSYGIPTKDRNIKTLPLDKIKVYVDRFIEYAKNHPEDTFILTAVGTGLAGYKHSDMAPMFIDAPNNVDFPNEWLEYKDN